MKLEPFLEQLPYEYYAWSAMSAYPRDPRKYIEVLDRVQAMTTPSTMHLLNFACQHLEPGEIYLETGTWRGATFIGALLGNHAHGYAIDNETMTDWNKDERGSAEVWRENVDRHGVGERATYISGSVPAVWKGLAVPPIGVYFFDGDKSTVQAAYDGLVGVVPFLAKQALILVDDANTTQIRQAVYVFCHEHREAVRLHELMTPANCWPSWWDGLIMLGWGLEVSVTKE